MKAFFLKILFNFREKTVLSENTERFYFILKLPNVEIWILLML